MDSTSGKSQQRHNIRRNESCSSSDGSVVCLDSPPKSAKAAVTVLTASKPVVVRTVSTSHENSPELEVRSNTSNNSQLGFNQIPAAQKTTTMTDADRALASAKNPKAPQAIHDDTATVHKPANNSQSTNGHVTPVTQNLLSEDEDDSPLPEVKVARKAPTVPFKKHVGVATTTKVARNHFQPGVRSPLAETHKHPSKTPTPPPVALSRGGCTDDEMRGEDAEEPSVHTGVLNKTPQPHHESRVFQHKPKAEYQEAESRDKKASDGEASQSEGEYEVERIEAERMRGKKKEYQVKWVGYEKCTWEPAENMENASAALKTFEEKNQERSLSKGKRKKETSTPLPAKETSAELQRRNLPSSAAPVMKKQVTMNRLKCQPPGNRASSTFASPMVSSVSPKQRFKSIETPSKKQSVASQEFSPRPGPGRALKTVVSAEKVGPVASQNVGGALAQSESGTKFVQPSECARSSSLLTQDVPNSLGRTPVGVVTSDQTSSALSTLGSPSVTITKISPTEALTKDEISPVQHAQSIGPPAVALRLSGIVTVDSTVVRISPGADLLPEAADNASDESPGEPQNAKDAEDSVRVPRAAAQNATKRMQDQLVSKPKKVASVKRSKLASDSEDDEFEAGFKLVQDLAASDPSKSGSPKKLRTIYDSDQILATNVPSSSVPVAVSDDKLKPVMDSSKYSAFIPIAKKGCSGVELKKFVVSIVAHKPANLVIQRVEDIEFLINYADHPKEFVSYEVCIKGIAHVVATYLARTPVMLFPNCM